MIYRLVSKTIICYFIADEGINSSALFRCIWDQSVKTLHIQCGRIDSQNVKLEIVFHKWNELLYYSSASEQEQQVTTDVPVPRVTASVALCR